MMMTMINIMTYILFIAVVCFFMGLILVAINNFVDMPSNIEYIVENAAIFLLSTWMFIMVCECAFWIGWIIFMFVKVVIVGG